MKYILTERQLRLIEDLEFKSRANDQEKQREEYINQILKGKTLKDLNNDDFEKVVNLKPEILTDELKRIYSKLDVFTSENYLSKKKTIKIHFKKREKRRFNQIKDNLKNLNPTKTDYELFMMMPEHEVRITIYFSGDSINIFYITSKGNISHSVTVYPLSTIFSKLDNIIKDPFRIW